MSTLYELQGVYLALTQMEDIDHEALKDTLEGLEGEIEDKADGYAKVIKNLQSDIEGIKTEEMRLKTRRDIIENRIQALKGNLHNAMKFVGKEKFKTQLFSFSIQSSPLSIDIADEEKAKETLKNTCYLKTVTTIDKKALLKAVKDGKTWEGITIKRGESLRIR